MPTPAEGPQSASLELGMTGGSAVTPVDRGVSTGDAQ